MHTRLVGRFALGLCFAGTPLTAQSPAKTAARTISGTVVDQQGTPLAGALVEFVSAQRRVASDSVGHFRLDAMPTTSVQLRVRHVGFDEQTVTVDAAPSDQTTIIFVKLERAATVLQEVNLGPLIATVDTTDALLRGFYVRSKTSHMGHFVTEQRIAELQPAFTSDALRNVPGVTVRPARIGNEVRIRGCAPLVWVDGTRAKGAQVDDIARPRDVAGIEIYDSLSGVPAEFTDRSATCGTILLWLKTR